MRKFQEYGEDYGGTLHAEGATVRKIPLVNVLCSNPMGREVVACLMLLMLTVLNR